MGHTEQAAKDARRRCFEMLDYFGLNSLFLSTTPDDECSFRVRLYCKPQYWVRSIYSKMEFIVFFHVFTMECLLFCNLFSWDFFIDIGCKRYNPKWNKSCCHLIIIFQNGISCFVSQVYPAILTWTLHFPVWTTKLKMFSRGLPCWFCVAKRHENEISRCLFFGISKCNANINKIHAQMGYKNTIIQRKRNTWHCVSIFRCGWRTGP